MDVTSAKRFFQVMDGVRVKKEGAEGPRKRPKVLIADSAYDTERIR